MTTRITLQVEVELEKTGGKFIGKDDLISEVSQSLEDSNPGEISVDDSTYEIVTWDIQEVPEVKKRK